MYISFENSLYRTNPHITVLLFQLKQIPFSNDLVLSCINSYESGRKAVTNYG